MGAEMFGPDFGSLIQNSKDELKSWADEKANTSLKNYAEALDETASYPHLCELVNYIIEKAEGSVKLATFLNSRQCRPGEWRFCIHAAKEVRSRESVNTLSLMTLEQVVRNQIDGRAGAARKPDLVMVRTGNKIYNPKVCIYFPSLYIAVLM